MMLSGGIFSGSVLLVLFLMLNNYCGFGWHLARQCAVSDGRCAIDQSLCCKRGRNSGFSARSTCWPAFGCTQSLDGKTPPK
jgi:hypothetical protein